ncbi:MAG: site-specific integrase [Microgenomates group bacterium]
MDKGYNLDNLEALFKKYLSAGNIKSLSVKNYLSDLRHFFEWLVFYLNSRGESKDLPLQQIITQTTIIDYKTYLLANNIPVKTINRRLSTLRKFCSFCISQGWMKENPAKHVPNISPIRSISPIGQILTQFHQGLLKEDLDQQTIKSYLEDIREFFTYVNKSYANKS